MKHFILITTLYFIYFNKILGQNEGWSPNCLSTLPTVSEIMIDAYGANEFFSEYIVLRVGEYPFDVRNLSFSVINPTNNAFIGSVKIDDYSTNNVSITQLNNKVSSSCFYNNVFRDIFAPPYNGIAPPHSAILVFNNKDSVDLSYLNNSAFESLCGSKVFTAFGTIKTQSPGVSIFRNHPRNGSCGTTGCLRKIQFQLEGASSPFCNTVTYDIKKLPHLNTSNPPDEYGDGSYIRPNSDGTINYGGGNLNGNGTPMPALSMMCILPQQPDFGVGLWNVSVFDGFNNFSNFKGFYQAKGNHVPIINAPEGSFEYNTIRDGWNPTDAPSEAHLAYGAFATYDGCNVKKDSFSTIARRKGFPCGNYELELVSNTDFARIKIDTDGDGTWEFDQSYNPTPCSSDCGINIWKGPLYSDSKVEIWSYDDTSDFNVHILFKKDVNDPSPLNISSNVIPTNCNSTLGRINLTVNGGIQPYSVSWQKGSKIANNELSPQNLSSGYYTAYVSDSKACKDSIRILVPQFNNIIANAGADTAFCTGGTAILRGSANIVNAQFEWRNEAGLLLSNQPNISVTPSIPSYFFLKTSDNNGCFDIDTVLVTVHEIPYFTLKMTPKDRVCNDVNPTFIVSKGFSYQWTTIPSIGISALNSTTSDTILLFSQLLPAISYTIFVEGSDGYGCKNTIQQSFKIDSLPIASITPIKDSICNTAPPFPLNVSPANSGRFYVHDLNGNIINDVIQNSMYYPNKTGVGKFTVYYEVTNSNGCKINPAIEINVKSCCNTPDTTFIDLKTCHISEVGISEKRFEKSNSCDSIVIIRTHIDTIFIENTSCNPSRAGRNIKLINNPSSCDSVVVTNTRLGSNIINFNLKTIQPISCFGKSDGAIEVNNISGGTPQYSIKWSTNSANSLIRNLNIGTYRVTVTDSESCTKEDSISLISPEPLNVEAVGIQAQCLGDEFGKVHIETLKGGIPPYTFSVDGRNRIMIDTPSFINNIRIGYHILNVKDKNNCSFDTSLQVKEGRELMIDIGTNTSLNLGDSILLNPISNHSIQNVQWVKNPAIECDTCFSIIVKPLTTSNFKIIVKDSLGCQASDNITIFVNKLRRVFIPTSFSPNGDGVNDIFMIYGSDEVKIIKTFQIYDRWGNQLFVSSNFLPNSTTNGWDGTFRDKMPTDGVFIYYAIVEFIDGKTDIYQGDVTLMR